MVLAVRTTSGQHRPFGDWLDLEVSNDFLDHLRVRGFSPATRRAYAFDLLNFGRFLQDRELALVAVTAMDVFGWVDWQNQPAPIKGKVLTLRSRTVAPSTVNRRVAAVRGLFEFLVMRQAITASPVPAPRRTSGLRPVPRGLLGHLGPGRRRTGGRLVRQDNRLPKSLPPADVDVFLSDFRTHRDRAVVLLMLLGGLRCAEVRGLLLRDVDMGRRRLQVVGKGGKERVVPVDELGAYPAQGTPRRPSHPGVLRGAARPDHPRGADGPGTTRDTEPTHEQVEVAAPEADTWTAELFDAEIDPQGEPVTLSTFRPRSSQQAPGRRRGRANGRPGDRPGRHAVHGPGRLLIELRLVRLDRSRG